MARNGLSRPCPLLIVRQCLPLLLSASRRVDFIPAADNITYCTFHVIGNYSMFHAGWVFNFAQVNKVIFDVVNLAGFFERC
jgi:hypothetical protein